MLYCGNVLSPAINAARCRAGAEARFERLHHRSVTLNSFVMIVGLGLFVEHANGPTMRRPPRPASSLHSMKMYQERCQENNRLNREFWRRHAAEIANSAVPNRPRRPVGDGRARGLRKPGARLIQLESSRPITEQVRVEGRRCSRCRR